MIDRKSVLPRSLLALALWSSCATAVAGNLRAGAARVDITPAADATNPATGKYAHEHLYVRAIVLDNGSARAVLVGADQAGLPEIVWTTQRSRLPKKQTARCRTSLCRQLTPTADGDRAGQGRECSTPTRMRLRHPSLAKFSTL